MEKGRFIAFEGGEGSGKTTQIKILEKTLYQKGIRSLITREPGGTPGGEDIRILLKNGDKNRWDGLSEALLLYAARHDHVEKVIKPALAQGIWVLSDRFCDSSFAYQAFGRDLGLAQLEALHQLVLGDFFPDLTFIFDIVPKESYVRVLKRQKRSKEGVDRFDDLDMEFHERVYKGYQVIAQKYAHRCRLIPAHISIQEVQAHIIQGIHHQFDIVL